MIKTQPNNLLQEERKTKKILLMVMALSSIFGLAGLMFALYQMLIHYKPLMAW